MTRTSHFIGFLLVAACSSSPPSPQLVSGRIEAATFSAPVTEVAVTRGTQTVTTAAVSASGDFALAIPVGTAYRLEFLTATGSVVLVSPRRLGGIDVTFNVRGDGAAFDVGQVRAIGDPRSQSFSFDAAASGECEDDGTDASGAVCVDDDDDEGETCDVESSTGGDSESGEAEDDGSEPTDAAVAEHNLPADMGCDDGSDDDDSSEGSDDGSDDGTTDGDGTDDGTDDGSTGSDDGSDESSSDG